MTNLSLVTAYINRYSSKLFSFVLIIVSFSPLINEITVSSAQSINIKPFVSAIKYISQNNYEVTFGYSAASDTRIAYGTNNNIKGIDNAQYTKEFYKGTTTDSFKIKTTCGKKIIWSVNKQTGIAETPICGARSEGSSCNNKNGWIENQNQRTATSKTYWVVRNPETLQSITPEINPTSFVSITCLSTSPIHYLKKDKYIDIDNDLEINKEGKYSNKANSFFVSFYKNPRDGFTYTAEDGSKIVFSNLQIGNIKSFNNVTVSSNKNVLTFKNILEGIDLVYSVESTGITKNFVINNISKDFDKLGKIKYDISIPNSKLQKTSTQTNIIKKLINDADATNIESKIKNLELQTNTTSDLKLKADNESIKKSLEAKSSALKTLSQSPSEDIKEAAQAKIDEPANDSDTITTSTGLLFSTPVSYDSKGNYYNETFKITNEGRTITIYPDLDKVNKDGSNLPYRIDPQITRPSASQDTWAGSYYPYSVRGINNSFHNVVGNNPCVNVGYGCAYMGNSHSYLQFQVPQEARYNDIISARLYVVQYGSSGAFNSYIDKFCDTGWSENSLTWSNRNQNWCGSYGSISFPYVNGAEWRVSTNIATAVKEGQASGSINLRLNDDNGQSDYSPNARGAVFCSKDPVSWHTCSHYDWAPFLEIEYNNAPTPPTAWTPSLVEKGLTCNLSTTPASGDCSSTDQVNFAVNGINDGEATATDANCNTIISQKSNLRTGYDWVVGPVNLGCGYRTTPNISVNNGIYDYVAVNRDQYGSLSANSNIQKYIVDKSAPVRINDESIKSSSANNQIQFDLKSIGDNLTTQYTISAIDTSNIKLFGKDLSIINNKVVTGTAGLVIKKVNETQVLASALDNNICLTFDNTNLAIIGAACTGFANQAVELNDNQIKNKSTNLCAEVKGANINDGTSIIANKCNNSEIQKLTLVGTKEKLNSNITWINYWASDINPINMQWNIESNGYIRGNGGNCITNDSWKPVLYSCLDVESRTWIVQNGIIKQKAGNYCLERNGTELLVTQNCSGNINSKWDIKALDDKEIYYTSPGDLQRNSDPFILTKNVNTSLFFSDDSDGKAYFYSQAVPGYNESIHMRVYTTPAKEIRLVKNNKLCMSYNAAAYIISANCDGSAKQKWNITKDGQITIMGDVLYCVVTAWSNINHATDIGIQNNGYQPFLFPCVSATTNGKADPITIWNIQYINSGKKEKNTQIWPTLATSYDVEYSENTDFNNAKSTGWINSSTVQFPNYDTKTGIGSTSITINNLAINSANDKVTLENINNSKEQSWTYSSRRELISKNNKCLNGNNNIVTLENCNGNSAQRWDLTTDKHIALVGSGLSVAQQNNGLILTNTSSNANQLFSTTTAFGDITTFKEGQKIYFRVRAKDRTSDQSLGNISKWYDLGATTFDSTLPVVISNSLKIKPIITSQSLTADDKRFGGKDNNGVKDAISIEYSFTENNTKAAGVAVYNINNGVRVLQRIITECEMNGVIATCTKHGQNFGSNNTVKFVWDGKNNFGENINDGKYDIQPIVMDNTCDGYDFAIITRDTCNFSYPVTGDTFVTLDNTGAAIAISTPFNGAWTNNKNIILDGGVAGFNTNGLEDKDVSGLKICEVSLTPNCTSADYKTVTLDVNKNFKYTTNLLDSNNQFKLQTTDLAGNINNNLNGINNQNWNINYDNVAPYFADAFVSNDSTNNIRFAFKDNLSGFGLIDDYTTSSEKKYIYDNLVVKMMYNGVTSTLFEKGTKILAAPSGSLLKDLRCSTLNSGSASNEINCFASMDKITADGVYGFTFTLKDLAGNTTTSPVYNYVVKTSTYNKLNNSNGVQTSDTVVISGAVERGNNISIKNNTTGSILNFVANANVNTIVPVESVGASSMLIAGQNVKIICSGVKVDHDKSSNTPVVEVCSYSILVRLSSDTSKAVINDISIITSDSYNNKTNDNIKYTIDVNAINLSAVQSVSAISPNGDGYNDSFIVTTSAKDNAGLVLPAVNNYKLEITSSSGQIVWTKSSSGIVPSNFVIDGKVNTGINVGKYFADDDYTIVFSITRIINNNAIVTATPASILRVRTLIDPTQQPVIATPATNMITTRGTLTVQGQGPVTANGRTWTIKGCVHQYVTGEVDTTVINPSSCVGDITFTTTTSSTGSYSTIVAVPNAVIGKFKLSVIAIDNLNVTTPASPMILFSLASTSAVQSLNLTGSLDGVNTSLEVDNLVYGTKSINDLKVLKIDAVVTQGTEALDIDFGYLDNYNQEYSYWDESYTLDDNHIATINGTKEPLGKFNPQGIEISANVAGKYYNQADSSIKAVNSWLDIKNNASNEYKQDNQVTTNTKQGLLDIANNTCKQATCTWTYLYPYPSNQKGGIFEVRTRAYKGDSITDTSRSLTINGQITSQPKVLRVDKGNGVLSTALDIINNTSYINSSQITAWIAADAYSSVPVRIKNKASGVITVLNNPSDAKPLKTNINGLMLDTTGSAGLLIDLSKYSVGRDGVFDIYLSPLSSAIDSTTKPDFTVVVDTVNPNINSVKTSIDTAYTKGCTTNFKLCANIDTEGNAYNVNSWIRSGDTAGFSVNANESLSNGSVISESGYKAEGKKIISKSCTYASTDYVYPSQALATNTNFTNCKSQYDTASSFYSSLQITAPNDTLEGRYDAMILLTDLAGNSSLITNNKVRTDKYLSTLTTDHVLKKAKLIVIDTSFRTQNKAILSAEDKLIINGSPTAGTDALPDNGTIYTFKNRAKSQDFSLYIDNTPPEMIKSIDMTKIGLVNRAA
jgi:Ricin-type beta-trefoil lectin domain